MSASKNIAGASELFTERAGGGWYVLGRDAPGVFVEPATATDTSPILTREEMDGPLCDSWLRCKWTGIGFDCARAYERVSFRAHCGDLIVMSPCNWKLTPGDGLETWAIEFPLGGRMVRRRFYCKTTYAATVRGKQ